MISSILSNTASSKSLGFEVVNISMIFPGPPVIESKTFKQSREYPEEEEGDVDKLPGSSSPDLIFVLLPSADSASSIMIMPPRRLVLAQVSSLLNSAGP